MTVAALTVLLSVGAAPLPARAQETYPHPGAMPGVALRGGFLGFSVWHDASGEWRPAWTSPVEENECGVRVTRSNGGTGSSSDIGCDDSSPGVWLLKPATPEVYAVAWEVYYNDSQHGRAPVVWWSAFYQEHADGWLISVDGSTVTLEFQGTGNGPDLDAWWWDGGEPQTAAVVKSGEVTGLSTLEDAPADRWVSFRNTNLPGIGRHVAVVHTGSGAAPPTKAEFDQGATSDWTGGDVDPLSPEEETAQGVTAIWNWFANIDEWVKGLFTASQETKDAYNDAKDGLMGKAPFVWVDAPISWLDSVVNHPCHGGGGAQCAVEGMEFEYVAGDQEGTFRFLNPTGTQDPEGAAGELASAARPITGALLYGSLFIGLGVMVWRRMLPGSDS